MNDGLLKHIVQYKMKHDKVVDNKMINDGEQIKGRFVFNCYSLSSPARFIPVTSQVCFGGLRSIFGP